MYSFLFDRKSLALLLAGVGTAAGLIFFGGLLTGLQLSLPPETLAAAPPSPAAQPAAMPAERPCDPETQAPAAEPAAPSTGEQWVATDLPLEEPAPPAEPEPVYEEPVPAAQPAVMKTAAQDLPAASAGGEGRYSIQVGAFRNAANSERVIQDLRGRGYEPYIVEERGRRVLRTVRVGRYADREEALRAASEFERSEGMDVIVRPL